jgi:hypothetical protein
MGFRSMSAEKSQGRLTPKYSRNLSGTRLARRIKKEGPSARRIMSPRDTHGAASKLANDKSAALHELEKMVAESASPERVSGKLAQILNVSRNEVAVLRVEKGSLRFVYPPELRAAGVIPMSSSAVAARTVATGTSLLSNSFARVKHASLFESVKLGIADDDRGSEQMPIQKIMSVPVPGPEGKVVGAIQVSRKGLDSSLAGTDFTNDDLKRLEQVAPILARMPFMNETVSLESAS